MLIEMVIMMSIKTIIMMIRIRMTMMLLVSDDDDCGDVDDDN